MPMTSTRCFRISGSRSCALAGRVIGAMTSGFAAFARETSVERSEGGSDQGMTSTISHDGLAALWAAMNPFDWFWPKRSFVYMSTTRLGATRAAAKISLKYRTARRPKLEPPEVGLGLRVAQQQLQLQPAERLDAARRVDRVRGHLSAEAARLARLGERARHGMDDAKLEGRRLGAQRARREAERRARRGGVEEHPTAESGQCHALFPQWCRWIIAPSAVESDSAGGRRSVVEQLLGDDQPLDLVRPLVDLHDLRVPHEALDGVLACVAVAPEDLDGVGRDLHRGVAGPALRHRRLVRVASDPRVHLTAG